MERQLWWCWAPPSTPRGSGYGAGSWLGPSFNPTPHPPSVCGRAVSRAASTKSHPAALTPSAAGPRPCARASPRPCKAKFDPPGRGWGLGCTSLCQLFPLFAFWAFLDESGLWVSPDQRPLISPSFPFPPGRAFYRASNFRGGSVPATLGIPSPPLLLMVLPEGGEDFF